MCLRFLGRPHDRPFGRFGGGKPLAEAFASPSKGPGAQLAAPARNGAQKATRLDEFPDNKNQWVIRKKDAELRNEVGYQAIPPVIFVLG